jgi:hypothetical protein
MGRLGFNDTNEKLPFSTGRTHQGLLADTDVKPLQVSSKKTRRADDVVRFSIHKACNVPREIVGILQSASGAR